MRHFENLYSFADPHISNDINELIPNSLDQEEINMLTAHPTHEEIKKVVFSFGSTKAPGLDGMIALFLQILLAYHMGECAKF